MRYFDPTALLVMQDASPRNSLARISSLPLPRSSAASLSNMNCTARTMRSMAADFIKTAIGSQRATLTAWEIKMLLTRTAVR